MKKIIVTGFVGTDPRIINTTSGKTFATFPLAVQGNRKENNKADWITANCNNQLTDLAMKYIKKGSRILIEGFPTISVFTAKDGKSIGSLIVYVHNLEFIGNPSNSSIPDSPVHSAPETVSSQEQDFSPF
jgi:single-strand DNA-binding protein